MLVYNRSCKKLNGNAATEECTVGGDLGVMTPIFLESSDFLSVTKKNTQVSSEQKSKRA